MRYYQFIHGTPLPEWLERDHQFEIALFQQYGTHHIRTPDGVKELKRGDFIVRREDFSLEVCSEQEFLRRQWKE